jgi:hypothetical protein
MSGRSENDDGEYSAPARVGLDATSRATAEVEVTGGKSAIKTTILRSAPQPR